MLAPQADNLSVLIFSKTAPYHGQDFEYRTSSHRSTGV